MARGLDYRNTLGFIWSKRERDYRIYYPERSSGWEIHDLIRSDAFRELENYLKENGYDLSTIRFSIKKKEV